MRLGLVANPTSGKGRFTDAAEIARWTLERLGYEVLVAAGESYDATRRAATALLEDRAGLDALVVIGGDGTVHLGLDVVASTPVPLGIVPVGTGNDIARHLGLQARDVAAAVRLIHLALTDQEGAKVVALDAVHATRPDGTPVPDEHEWCLAVVSAGIDAAVNARANTLSWPSGEGRYMRAIPYEVRHMAPYGYRVTTDAGTWEGAAVLLAVANTRYLGGGLDIVPVADPVDGLLDVIRLDPVSRTSLLGHLARLRKGTHMHHPAVHHERSRVVTIEAWSGPQDLRRPPHPMADGEPVADLPLRLEAVQEAVRVIVPSRR
ncbi:diacylglycerol/lipid kinase family protein [Actinomyces faecalis]|uniref:diacylglycerol/lipid kinase family protein n=1 Tax=Actinomyces faecalis TaxID=2722820 RepID=UPI0015546771|nr:diacylglycerol kinase family protein [Actinomyces faecalis]